MRRQLVFWAPQVLSLLTPIAAMAHKNREPGLSGFIDHQYSVHTSETFLFLGGAIFVVIFILYSVYLEPDFAKEAKRRRQKEKKNGGTFGGGGCSGCGGCS